MRGREFDLTTFYWRQLYYFSNSNGASSNFTQFSGHGYTPVKSSNYISVFLGIRTFQLTTFYLTLIDLETFQFTATANLGLGWGVRVNGQEEVKNWNHWGVKCCEMKSHVPSLQSKASYGRLSYFYYHVASLNNSLIWTQYCGHTFFNS